MRRDWRYWTLAALFQACFGLVVFVLTRSYYAPEPAVPGPDATRILESLPRWPDPVAVIGPAPPGQPPAVPAANADPATLWRTAEESFSSGQYATAAEAYQQLLVLEPESVELYNNLGLTLHYLGRSTEALETLKAGTARDPSHQRTWLDDGLRACPARQCRGGARRVGQGPGRPRRGHSPVSRGDAGQPSPEAGHVWPPTHAHDLHSSSDPG